VIIVKFLDWQCPACKMAYFQYKPILEKFAASHPGAVKEVTRDYPLSSKCNFNIPQLAHQAACEAAAAVRLARQQGKEQALIDFFFTSPAQQGITPDAVKIQTEKLLGITDFDRQYKTLLPAIQQDVADGHALGVTGTPTYFVNGVNTMQRNNWLPPHYFELAIKIELEAAGR
jgi:protein-disulfide isomerase